MFYVKLQTSLKYGNYENNILPILLYALTNLCLSCISIYLLLSISLPKYACLWWPKNPSIGGYIGLHQAFFRGCGSRPYLCRNLPCFRQLSCCTLDWFVRSKREREGRKAPSLGHQPNWRLKGR